MVSCAQNFVCGNICAKGNLMANGGVAGEGGDEEGIPDAGFHQIQLIFGTSMDKQKGPKFGE
jgi:hypothetical protein